MLFNKYNIQELDITSLEEVSEKEIKCIAYSRYLISNNEGDKLDDFINETQKLSMIYLVPPIKNFYHLWEVHGMKNYGISCKHRGTIDPELKRKCIKYWFETLYNKPFHYERFKEVIDNHLFNEYQEFKKRNPNGHISFLEPIDYVPTMIYENYEHYKI